MADSGLNWFSSEVSKSFSFIVITEGDSSGAFKGRSGRCFFPESCGDSSKGTSAESRVSSVFAQAY